MNHTITLEARMSLFVLRMSQIHIKQRDQMVRHTGGDPASSMKAFPVAMMQPSRKTSIKNTKWHFVGIIFN